MSSVTRAARRLPVLALLAVVSAMTGACGGKESTSPPVPVAVEKVSGDGQSGTAHDALAQPLVVKVVDASGAGVAGVKIVWATSYPGGSDLDSSTTGQTGVARLAMTLDTVAGSYTVTASATQLSPVIFTITCRPGPIAMLRILVQPPNGTVLTVLSPPVQVEVADQWGNNVPSNAVNLYVWITVGSGTAGAQLGGTTTRTTNEGVATFDDLTIDRAGVGYTLAFRSDYPLLGVWSESFAVTGP